MAVATRRRADPKGEGRWTKVQAHALLRAVEDMFHRRDIDALVKGFTEDCVFRFAEQPEQRGRDPLRKFFTARLERQKNYRLKKTLLALDRNLIANLGGDLGRYQHRKADDGAWSRSVEDARWDDRRVGCGLQRVGAGRRAEIIDYVVLRRSITTLRQLVAVHSDRRCDPCP